MTAFRRLPWLATLLVAAALAPAAPGAPRADPAAEKPIDRIQRLQEERIRVIDRLTPSVISVFRVNKHSGELNPGSGSGVVISPDGYALTNYHVTEQFEELRAGAPGGKIYKARLCGLDRTGDIAMIKLDSPEALPCVELGSSDALAVGDWIIAMGNPFQLATDFRPTVSLGVVSGLHRYLPGGGAMQKDLVYTDAIQIDAAINPGNSGGPLFDLQGRLVGINGRISLRRVSGMEVQRTNAGIGFAVPIDSVKPFLEDLKAGREVERGYLGVSRASIVDDGLKIEQVSTDSPAEIFDLRRGDVILKIDGREVHDPGELQNVVGTRPAGTRIDIELRRGQETIHRTVQLAGRQSAALLREAQKQEGILWPESFLKRKDAGGDETPPEKPESPAPQDDQKAPDAPDGE